MAKVNKIFQLRELSAKIKTRSAKSLRNAEINASNLAYPNFDTKNMSFYPNFNTKKLLFEKNCWSREWSSLLTS